MYNRKNASDETAGEITCCGTCDCATCHGICPENGCHCKAANRTEVQ